MKVLDAIRTVVTAGCQFPRQAPMAAWVSVRPIHPVLPGQGKSSVLVIEKSVVKTRSGVSVDS